MNSINSPFNLPTFIAAIKWLTQVIDVDSGVMMS